MKEWGRGSCKWWVFSDFLFFLELPCSISCSFSSCVLSIRGYIVYMFHFSWSGRTWHNGNKFLMTAFLFSTWGPVVRKIWLYENSKMIERAQKTLQKERKRKEERRTEGKKGGRREKKKIEEGTSLSLLKEWRKKKQVEKRGKKKQRHTCTGRLY